jgi:hypothetical protein
MEIESFIYRQTILDASETMKAFTQYLNYVQDFVEKEADLNINVIMK